MRVPRPISAATGSARRLFGVYAAASLVPVVALGLLLTSLTRAESTRRGVAEARSQATVLADTAISPVVGGRDLRGGLTPRQRAMLARNLRAAQAAGQVLRIRVRADDGRVVFSGDGSGLGRVVLDDEVEEAVSGETVSLLTRLNEDENDRGNAGPRAVEVYRPLAAPGTDRVVGVLEVYLSYDPIARDLAASQRRTTAALLAGLVALWLVLLAISFSVTRRLRRQVEVSRWLAEHDPLTRLPNRSCFAARVTSALRASRAGRGVAVALLDVDRFKEVNDTLGHGTGDRLLVELAQRMTELADVDCVARLGGDEFGILLTGVADDDDAIGRLTRLRAALNLPAELGPLPLAAEVSVGVAVAPADGSDVELLMQRADVAMYHAKRGHGGIARYQPEQDVYDATTLALLAELPSAIADDALVLHYQPKYDAATGAIVAAEALVRWQHPLRGLLYPDVFVPAVEQTELMDELTTWVVRAAARALPDLAARGAGCVAVNVSARSLARASFADDILAILAETGTSADRVILEITETALMVDPARAAATLERLATAGLRISIDDFGVGQTSLGYLATLPITELKIDKRFVRDVLVDDRMRAIVTSIVDLGHSLGFTVTAEGVESASVLEALTAIGCDTVQGYLYAPPLPIADLVAERAGTPLLS